MSFKISLHPDAVKFLVDLNAETKESLRECLNIKFNSTIGTGLTHLNRKALALSR